MLARYPDLGQGVGLVVAIAPVVYGELLLKLATKLACLPIDIML
jgi:hypothetical protein